jgi:cytochrome c oxidase cbb3-type subunit 3
MANHEHDGITELDNVLPRWWLQILWGTVLFALGYWLYYQVFATGESPLTAYKREKMLAAQAEAERLKAQGELTPDRLVAMSKNVAIVSAGKATFVATCASCHAQNAGGQVGPNLTDEYWLHGGKPEQILATIRGGVLPKGMPAWGPQLGEEKVREVAAYVLSIRNTHVPGGKPPQGDAEPQ